MNKNVKNKWAVVGFDYVRAIEIMSEIEKTCGKTISKKSRANMN